VTGYLGSVPGGGDPDDPDEPTPEQETYAEHVADCRSCTPGRHCLAGASLLDDAQASSTGVWSLPSDDPDLGIGGE
jgi:hypothetical protein